MRGNHEAFRWHPTGGRDHARLALVLAGLLVAGIVVYLATSTPRLREVATQIPELPLHRPFEARATTTPPIRVLNQGAAEAPSTEHSRIATEALSKPASVRDYRALRLQMLRQ
jgi:hypothetical protein